MDFRNNLLVYKIIIFPLFIFTESFWVIKSGKLGHGPFNPDISSTPTSAILIRKIPDKVIGKSSYYKKEPNIILSYNPNYYFLVLNNPEDHPQREIRSTLDSLSPRFFKPFPLFGGGRGEKRPKKEDPKKRKEKILQRTCNTLGGTVVEGECYEYIPEVLPFDQAQARCAVKNGHLFTPNFDDLEYFDKLRLAMKDFLDAPRNEIWVGARIAASGRAIDVNGIDVTNTQQFKLDFTYFDFDENLDACAILNFDFGGPIIDNPPCESEYSFICEYRIDSDRIMQQEEENNNNNNYNNNNNNNNNRFSIVFDKNPFFFLKNFIVKK